jgi:ATP-dependent Clp protease ATP-binding subunit ClpC
MDDTYEGALLRDGRDLVAAAREGRLDVADHREEEVRQVVEALDAGRSVVLVGPDGVGKTAIVNAVADALAEKEGGRLVQLSTTAILAGTRYLGEWQSKVTQIARQAAEHRAFLYFSDVWHLPWAGVTAQSKTNMLDALVPFLESGELVLLGEASPEHLRRMEQTPRFVDRFEKVTVTPLDSQKVDGVLLRAAMRLGLEVDASTRHALVQLTSRFLPKRPQPAPAMTLLGRVADYHRQKKEIGESEPVTPAFVEKVLSIYSGLPLFIVSSTSTKRAAEIRQWFQERIVGQHEAVEAVVETIALFKAGLHDPNRPLGTFLFVGPTGVGKTEVARAVARFLFGSAQRLLSFDLSEFKDYHAFERLLGTPGRPDRPARLVDPVLAQPFQVVLFDELEKAHSNVWDVLLPLLDEGRVTTPDGRMVDFRSTLVIATSNAGTPESDAVGFGATKADWPERQRTALQEHFRPEFLNRFQHIVAFHQLSTDQVRAVARQELRRVFQREGITGRNLVVEVDDGALDLVIQRGVDRRYGARALKREIQRQIVLPLALHLMEREVDPGQIIRVTAHLGSMRIRMVDTPESRAARREREPVRLDGRKLVASDLAPGVQQLRDRVDEIASRVDEEFLIEERARLLELRAEHGFWQHAEHAARALRDLDRATVILDRLDRLRERVEDLGEEVASMQTRRELDRAARRLVALERSAEFAFRELVHMGDEGVWDALVEIGPLGLTGRLARDLLVDVYSKWAIARRMEVQWLRVPRADDEPAMVAIKGRYAHGMLRLEEGLHKVQDGDDHGAARVRVAPWTDRTIPMVFGAHRALKGVGHYQQKVRSRLECQGGLVLQNAHTLAENRDLAVELAGSWAEALPPSDVIVRRYDVEAPLLRDVFTGFSSGRPDATEPARFHELLCRRVDEAGESSPQTA